MIELWKRGEDPEAIKITASDNFTDKLVIETSPKKSKWSSTIESDQGDRKWKR